MQVPAVVLNSAPASRGEICRVTELSIISQGLLSCNWTRNLTLHTIPAHFSEVLFNCVITSLLINVACNPALPERGSSC